MTTLTLLRQANPLAEPARQVDILNTRHAESLPEFDKVLKTRELPAMQAAGIDVLQVNVGKLCNQTCGHCHVDAGPDRREAMALETAKACVRALTECDIPTLDITGGAPEMNPHFQWMVHEARGVGRRVIDRCNLTILVAPGFDELPEFLAEHRVEIVASLPCYLEENCDRQRGNGVFLRSIAALRRLNDLGYGSNDGLSLALVYNPLGTALPPPQHKLEETYRRELRDRYGVEFTRLFTITNMPISRFLDHLMRNGTYEMYMRTLVDAFNPLTVQEVMCRSTLSVDWRGQLFDCDFNQMLDLEIDSGLPRNIRDIDRNTIERLARRRIATGRHCFGCTAGAGSSCQGSLSG